MKICVKIQPVTTFEVCFQIRSILIYHISYKKNPIKKQTLQGFKEEMYQRPMANFLDIIS